MNTLCSECKENANTLSSSQDYPIALVVVSIAVKQNAPKQHMFAVTQFLWVSSSGVAFWVSHLGCRKGSVNMWSKTGFSPEIQRRRDPLSSSLGLLAEVISLPLWHSGPPFVASCHLEAILSPCSMPTVSFHGTSPNMTTRFIDLARKRKPPARRMYT